MKPTISFVLQLSPSTAYENLEAVARNLLDGLNVIFNSGLVKCSVFMDGPTLEMVRRVAKPLMFGKIKNAIRDGSFEFLGGGFYDPMLPLFPNEIQARQLEMHRELLKKSFNVEPQGYFNSSLVWEMGMTAMLEKSGFDYALVTESAVQDALGRSTPVSGWFTVEDKGFFMRIVPVAEGLSRAIEGDDLRWREIAEAYCRGGKSAVAVFELPSQPNEIVGFFERLVDFVETNDVQTRTVGFAVNQLETCGSLSFLVSAGRKLGLPSTARTCRELLIRRPEINMLHKAFLNLYHRGWASLEEKKWLEYSKKLLPITAPRFFRDLFNDEGMQSMKIRESANKCLLQAASALDEAMDFSGLRVEVCDYLLLGRMLIWLENRNYSCLLDYHCGGVIRSLNYKASLTNMLNSWRNDGEPAFGFLDCILPNVDLTPAKLEQALYDRNNLLADPYDYRIMRVDSGIEVVLEEEQGFALGEKQGLFRMKKSFFFEGETSKFSVSYDIENLAYVEAKGFFGSILELGLLSSGSKDCVRIDGKKIAWNMKEPLLYPDGKSVDIVADLQGCEFHLTFERPTSIFIGAIFGASTSAAPEAFQGIRVFPFWKAPFDILGVNKYKISVAITRRS